MSPRTNAPAPVTADAGTGPPGATAGAHAADEGAESESEADSDLRTATRLLRLVKLALGIVVSLLTALKLLGLL